MDFTKRRQIESAFKVCLFTAKLIIWCWEADRTMICNSKHVGMLREMIKRLSESFSLKLWYPLPHLNK